MEQYQQARAQLTASRIAQADLDAAIAHDALGVVHGALAELRSQLGAGGAIPAAVTYAQIKERLDAQIWPSMGDAAASLQRARDHLATLAALVEPAPWPAE